MASRSWHPSQNTAQQHALMRLGIYFLLIGIAMVGLIIGLFWLKDRLESIRIAQLAHSEPIARLAVIGAALAVIGLLLILSSQF